MNNVFEKTKPIVWTIAGSDPSCGAGMQADLATLRALGVYPCGVLTTLIAQSACRVGAVFPIPDGFLAAQVECLLRDLPPPDAVKIGLIGHIPSICELAPFLKDFFAAKCPIIFDPVLSATAGYDFASPSTLSAIRENIFPYVTLLTPNLPEAFRILSYSENIKPKRNVDKIDKHDMEELARGLLRLSPRAVLLKGGHFAGNEEVISDFFVSAEGEACWLSLPRVENRHTHGTGCFLSSAIAAAKALAPDLPLSEAVAKAKATLQKALFLGEYGAPMRIEWATEPQYTPKREIVL